MATFTRIEIWTDVACNSGVRVAAFERDQLTAAQMKLALTGTEQLTFTLPRTASAIAEVVHARIARACWSDSSLDSEWRITEDTSQSGRGDVGSVTVTAQPLYLDLARAVYVAWDATTGVPTFAVVAAQNTPSEILTTYALGAASEAGLSWVAVGTVTPTGELEFSDEYLSALEIIKACIAPGRATAEFDFRRNGSTDYKIDLVTTRGSSANTVRVQTGKNLLAHQRTRRLQDVETKIMPRGVSGAATRDMGRAMWEIASVVSGTVLELADPMGGAGPIAFDAQLDGLYLAMIDSTFASQAMSSTTASTQRVTITDTTGMSAGRFVEFRRTSGASGERLASLQHPTRALAPASSGYGKRTVVYAVDALTGNCNLVKNPWARDWSNHANPPDDWTAGGTGWAQTYSTAFTQYGGAAVKCVEDAAGTTPYVRSPVLYPFTTAGLRFSAHVWIYCETAGSEIRFRMQTVAAATLATISDSPAAGEWVQLALTDVDVSSAAAGLYLEVTNVSTLNTGFTIYIDAFSMNEGAETIPDIEYSDGTRLHQATNVRLAAKSDIIAGYTLDLTDLSRLDGATWNDEPLTLGGTLEVIDTDLSITSSQRVVELGMDLLNPLVSTVQLANRTETLTDRLAA